jgi:hypothetical protein
VKCEKWLSPGMEIVFFSSYLLFFTPAHCHTVKPGGRETRGHREPPLPVHAATGDACTPSPSVAGVPVTSTVRYVVRGDVERAQDLTTLLDSFLAASRHTFFLFLIIQ